MEEIKVFGDQLHGVLISGGHEWVPGPNHYIYIYEFIIILNHGYM